VRTITRSIRSSITSALPLAYFGKADVPVGISLGMTVLFLLICVAVVGWIFRTGYRLRN